MNENGRNLNIWNWNYIMTYNPQYYLLQHTNKLFRSKHINIVLKAIKRSLTTSFGSICFGSLLVAILRLLQVIVHFITEKMKRLQTNINSTRRLTLFVLSCLSSLLKVLDKSVSYFNRYAFTYVGIYGLDFMSASR